MGPTIFHKIFLNISHIQTECGKYSGIFYEILPIPQNIVMNLNDVMNLIHKFIYIEKETITLHPHVRTKSITMCKVSWKQFNLAKLYDPSFDAHKSKLGYAMWMRFDNVDFLLAWREQTLEWTHACPKSTHDIENNTTYHCRTFAVPKCMIMNVF